VIALSPTENKAELIDVSGTFTTTINNYNVSNTPIWQAYPAATGTQTVVLADYIDSHSLSYGTVSSGYVWQGFTTTSTTYLNEIDLSVDGNGSPCTCTASLYTGLGIGGTLLRQWSVTLPANPTYSRQGSYTVYNSIFVAPTQLPLQITAQQYTIQLTIVSGTIHYATDLFGPHEFNINGTGQGNNDLGVYVTGAALSGYYVFCSGIAGTVIENVNSQCTVQAPFTSYGSGTYPSGSYNNGIVYNSATVTTYNVSDVLTVTNTTNSSSTTTGAIVTAGGLGVAENVNIGGNLTVGYSATFNDIIWLNGHTALGTDVYQTIFAGFPGNSIGRCFIGNGSGYQFTFAKRASSVTTDVVSITDSGAISAASGLGLFGTSALTSKPTVTGSKGSNVALASLITALANYGLITDSTT